MPNRQRISSWIAFCSAVLLLPALAFGADAVNPGKQMYLRYCSACHGPGGKGDGVVSQLMRPQPTDLTQLAKNADGKYPFNRVMRVIDGKDTVRAHGDPDMPVWGELLADEEGHTPQRNTVVRGKVVQITQFVETLQEK